MSTQAGSVTKVQPLTMASPLSVSRSSHAVCGHHVPLQTVCIRSAPARVELKAFNEARGHVWIAPVLHRKN